jgi:hypothetical protein
MTFQEQKHLTVAETHVDMGSVLSLTLEALVKTSPLDGLTDTQVSDRLKEFGHNGSFQVMYNYDRN